MCNIAIEVALIWITCQPLVQGSFEGEVYTAVVDLNIGCVDWNELYAIC